MVWRLPSVYDIFRNKGGDAICQATHSGENQPMALERIRLCSRLYGRNVLKVCVSTLVSGTLSNSKDRVKTRYISCHNYFHQNEG